MKILDGKATSAKVKAEVKERASALKNAGIEPALAVILVGSDKASQTSQRYPRGDAQTTTNHQPKRASSAHKRFKFRR